MHLVPLTFIKEVRTFIKAQEHLSKERANEQLHAQDDELQLIIVVCVRLQDSL